MKKFETIKELMKNGKSEEGKRILKELGYQFGTLRSLNGYEIIEVHEACFFIECNTVINNTFTAYAYIPLSA